MDLFSRPSISFYGIQGPYAEFSNMFPVENLIIDGMIYPSIEHFFQASKCLNNQDKRKIMTMKSPFDARRLGRKVRLRPDWEEIKVDIMRKGLSAKFHIPHFQKLLLSTQSCLLEEKNPYDNFWGTGKDKQGRNQMGKLLMLIRTEMSQKKNEM